MTRFDSIHGDDDTITPAEGVTGIVLTGLASDGKATDAEIEHLAQSLARMNLFRGASVDDIADAFDRMAQFGLDTDPETLVRESANAIPEDLRDTTFAITADLVYADKEVTAGEDAWLERIRHELGITQTAAEPILETMRIKHDM